VANAFGLSSLYCVQEAPVRLDPRDTPLGPADRNSRSFFAMDTNIQRLFQLTAGRKIFQLTTGGKIFQLTAGGKIFQLTAGSKIFQLTAVRKIFQLTAGGKIFQLTAGGKTQIFLYNIAISHITRNYRPATGHDVSVKHNAAKMSVSETSARFTQTVYDNATDVAHRVLGWKACTLKRVHTVFHIYCLFYSQ
jgi:hypothetical protein